jgi:DNA-binding transcriptional MerR regulator
MKSYTIGQAAKLVDLPAKTIRFYEEAGIISATERAANGYRTYSETAIEELTLIKYARDLGLPVSEIKKLIVGCSCDQHSCEHTHAQIIADIENYTTILSAKINQFSILKDKLGQLKINLSTNDKNCKDQHYTCNILRQLAEIK